MNILLTNDDGYGTEGINALVEAFREHDVWVVAPDGERSGMSHALTMRSPVRFVEKGNRHYACSGNPVDCVLYSLQGALPVQADLVISGINHGPNLGTDLIYSGTAAASRQAVLMGIPGFAVSQIIGNEGCDFRQAAEFLAGNLDRFLGVWNDSHFININFPAVFDDSARISICKPSRRGYSDVVESYRAPDGSTYHFLRGKGAYAEKSEGSDWEAVTHGDIAVTPVHLHPQIDSGFKKYMEVFS